LSDVVKEGKREMKKGWRLLNIRVTDKQHERLREEAFTKRRSISDLVREELEARYGVEANDLVIDGRKSEDVGWE
jgi:predicted HicB family RNase H-like nuclease